MSSVSIIFTCGLCLSLSLQVAQGNYLLPVPDAIQLAALQLVSALEGVDAEGVSADSLTKQLSTFISAQTVVDAVLRHGTSVVSLVVSEQTRSPMRRSYT